MKSQTFDPVPRERLIKDSVYTQWNSVDGYQGSYLAGWGYLQKTWDVTPGFFTLKAAGDQLPSQPYHLLHTTTVSPWGAFRWWPLSNPDQWRKNAGLLTHQYAYFEPALASGDDILDGVIASANRKALSAIKSQKVNLLQAYGERRQTARLIETNLVRMARAVTAAKRGDIQGCLFSFGMLDDKKAPKFLKRALVKYRREQVKQEQTLWQALLEIQYGWKTLITDIYGSIEAVEASRNRVHEQRVTVTAYNRDERSRVRRAGLGDAIIIDDRWYDSAQAQVSCVFRVVSEAARTLAEAGITNPLLFAWELTPWSFVADWALPIGEWLGNIDATAGVEFSRGTLSWKRVCRAQSRARGTTSTGPFGSWTYSGDAESYQCVEEVDRTPLGAFPSNPLPQLKNPLSVVHVFNAIALLRTAFKTVR